MRKLASSSESYPSARYSIVTSDLMTAIQLIAEVHQSEEIMGPVQAVIPNTPKAERMILMMNKNVPAYVGNVLKDQGMPEDFLMELVRKSCCPTQISKMATCTWDSDSGSLTTQQETAEVNNHIVLETAS